MIKWLLLTIVVLVPLYIGVWYPRAPFDLPKAIMLCVLSFIILLIWFVESIKLKNL